MTQKERIEKVREALNNGKCLSVEFYKDGSGACFHFIDPHGEPRITMRLVDVFSN